MDRGTFPDYHLSPEAMTTAWDCQDGGFDPTGHVVEEREKAQEANGTEKEEEEDPKPKKTT